MTTFSVQTKEGPKVIEGEAYGMLALHRALGDEDLFSVTHIPTGLSIFITEFEREALGLIEFLERQIGKELDFTNVKSPQAGQLTHLVREWYDKDFHERISLA